MRRSITWALEGDKAVVHESASSSCSKLLLVSLSQLSTMRSTKLSLASTANMVLSAELFLLIGLLSQAASFSNNASPEH